MENSEERFKVLSETIILVNLDAPPKVPSRDVKIEENIGDGWVKVEKRGDELYIDGRKVILYLSEQQVGRNVIRGSELHKELTGKPVLHPNVLDALLEHQNLIPEGWKKDNNGNIRYISFWAVIFCDSIGLLYVRRLCFRGDEWGWDGCWLVRDWNGSSPAALLES